MLNEMTTENLVTFASEAFEAGDDEQAKLIAQELRNRGSQRAAENIEDALEVRAIGSTLRTAGDWAHGGNVTSTAKAWLEAGFTAEQVSEWLSAKCFEPWAAAELRGANILPGEAEAKHEIGGISETLGYWVSNSDLSVARAAELAHA